MTEKSLIQVLNARLEVAQRFTKEFKESVDSWIEDYNAETPKATTIEDILDSDQRYQYTAKVIFDNVEKYRSSFFEKPPEVMYTKKGKNDEEKAVKVESAWQYLKDKTNFKQFMDDTFTYFGLAGFTTGHIGYRKETETATGEDGVEYTRFLYDDPILEAYDHENEWFMPDSVFSPDAKQVSYFRKKKMTKSEARKAFNKDVETDESILSKDVNEEKENIKSELMKCGIYYYTGTLPQKELLGYLQSQEGSEIEIPEDMDDSETKDILYAVFTKKSILKIDKSPIGEQTCALGRWYSLPQKFFGFGLGKQLKEQQIRESIGTGQKVRYADLYAFPKMAIDAKDAGQDPKQLMKRSNPLITYVKTKPEYIMPPGSNGAIEAMQNQNQSDIQTNSGLTDISKMQQSSTLQTATGQTQVADSNEKRVKVAKEKYFEFLKQIIIKMFKYAQVEWQDTKIQTITDEDGNAQDIEMTKEDFADINFDTDIAIDFESTSVNKDVVRQQAIVLYDKVKEDPLVDRAKVFKKMLKDGFGEKNPDQYIKQSTVQPGMTFMGADGQEYIADESGSVVLRSDLEQTMPSDGDMTPASSQSAIQSNPMTNV
jgi:hypothetical protein